MSQIPATSLDELYQIELHLEEGFKALLREVALFNTYTEYSDNTLQTPYVTVAITSAGVEISGNRHAHVFEDGTQAWDAWGAVLETEICTNRDDDTAKQHHLALGKMRRALQLRAVRPVWMKYEDRILITDIRELSTIHTWDDDKSLDHTVISWQLVVNINPAAWPVNEGIPS